MRDATSVLESRANRGRRSDHQDDVPDAHRGVQPRLKGSTCATLSV